MSLLCLAYSTFYFSHRDSWCIPFCTLFHGHGLLTLLFLCAMRLYTDMPCHDGMPWFDPIFFSLYRRLIIFSITAYCVSSVNTFKAYHIIVRPLCKKHQKLVWLSQHTIYKYYKPVNSFRSLCCVIECWIMPESVMSFCLSSCLLTDLTCHEWSLGT